MPNFYEINPDDFFYFLSGRKKHKKEFKKAINEFIVKNQEGRCWFSF